MAVLQVYQDNRREWRWRLVAPNGRTMADSGEGYATRQNCLNAIESVKGYMLTAVVAG
jgi:hypothetical protein